MAFDPSKIRLFVDADLTAGAEIALEAGQAHYLRAVMRREVGETLYLFNGRDGEWLATLTALSKKAAAARPDRLVRAQSGGPDLMLCFAPIKGARLDFVAQKATEMGVSVIQPVITERTVVRNLRTDKLRANAVEAAEQCECMAVPEIREPVKLEALLGAWDAGRALVFCDEGGSHHPVEALQAIVGQSGAWAVLVGPEGGFSDTERDHIRGVPGALPISLGPRILRADTAAVAALALVQSILGDWHEAPRQASVPS